MNSLSHKTIEDNANMSSKRDSIVGSGPTFDPRLNRSNGVAGVIKTPSVSQTSNVPDLKELNEDDINKPIGMVIQKRNSEAAKDKASSGTSNVMTFQDNTNSKKVSSGG